MLMVYEPVCHGLEHALFNSGILAAGLEMSGGRVIFAAEASHLTSVRESSPSDVQRAVDWHQVAIAPRRLKGFWARFSYERRLLQEVAKMAGERSVKAVVSTGITEPGLLALKLKLWSSPSTWPVGVVFHSVLRRFLYSKRRRFFLHAATPRRLRFLLLSEAIRAAAVELVPQIASKAFVVPQPLPIGLEAGRVDLDPTRLVFAFLGRGYGDKGFPLFLHMACELAGDPRSAAAEFEVIGSYSADFQAEVRGLIDSGGGRFRAPVDSGTEVPRDLYEARMREATYAVMPYSTEVYRFTWSGTALDAIAAAMPMIALRSALFEDLFSRMGDIGYLCADYAELVRVVREIAANPPYARYEHQRENLIRGRELFGTRLVAKRLAEALGHPTF